MNTQHIVSIFSFFLIFCSEEVGVVRASGPVTETNLVIKNKTYSPSNDVYVPAEGSISIQSGGNYTILKDYTLDLDGNISTSANGVLVIEGTFDLTNGTIGTTLKIKTSNTAGALNNLKIGSSIFKTANITIQLVSGKKINLDYTADMVGGTSGSVQVINNRIVATVGNPGTPPTFASVLSSRFKSSIATTTNFVQGTATYNPVSTAIPTFSLENFLANTTFNNANVTLPISVAKTILSDTIVTKNYNEIKCKLEGSTTDSDLIFQTSSDNNKIIFSGNNTALKSNIILESGLTDITYGANSYPQGSIQYLSPSQNISVTGPNTIPKDRLLTANGNVSGVLTIEGTLDITNATIPSTLTIATSATTGAQNKLKIGNRILKTLFAVQLTSGKKINLDYTAAMIGSTPGSVQAINNRIVPVVGNPGRVPDFATEILPERFATTIATATNFASGIATYTPVSTAIPTYSLESFLSNTTFNNPNITFPISVAKIILSDTIVTKNYNEIKCKLEGSTTDSDLTFQTSSNNNKIILSGDNSALNSNIFIASNLTDIVYGINSYPQGHVDYLSDKQKIKIEGTNSIPGADFTTDPLILDKGPVTFKRKVKL